MQDYGSRDEHENFIRSGQAHDSYYVTINEPEKLIWADAPTVALSNEKSKENITADEKNIQLKTNYYYHCVANYHPL